MTFCARGGHRVRRALPPRARHRRRRHGRRVRAAHIETNRRRALRSCTRRSSLHGAEQPDGAPLSNPLTSTRPWNVTGARFPWAHWAYRVTVFTLTLLAAVPFWLTDLLPMIDYPPFLTFVRAFQDHGDPASPFHGTYTTGWPVAPLVLPILLARAIAAASSIGIAGKVLLTAYTVALPAASMLLLRVLRRDRWCVLLVFPLVHSYWVSGGFFAFATAPPLVVLGLAVAVRWLDRPTPRLGVGLAAIAVALLLWHALALAQLLLDVALLWALWRAPGPRERWRALLPLTPSLALFAVWVGMSVLTRPSGAPVPGPVAAWPPFFENAAQLPEFVGVLLPISVGYVLLFALLVVAGATAEPAAPHASPESPTARYRVPNAFAVLALASVVCHLVLPSYCLGVEGINNRHPWMAALLFTFAWSLPARPAPRAGLLASMAIGGGALLLHLCGRFVDFHRETVERLPAHRQAISRPNAAGAPRRVGGDGGVPRQDRSAR